MSSVSAAGSPSRCRSSCAGHCCVGLQRVSQVAPPSIVFRLSWPGPSTSVMLVKSICCNASVAVSVVPGGTGCPSSRVCRVICNGNVSIVRAESRVPSGRERTATSPRRQSLRSLASRNARPATAATSAGLIQSARRRWKVCPQSPRPDPGEKGGPETWRKGPPWSWACGEPCS